MKLTRITKNKKAVSTVPVVKFTPHYELDGDTIDDISDIFDSEGNWDLDYVTKERSFNSDFSLEPLPMCCGISEVGNLSVSDNHPKLTEILDVLVASNKGKTLILNTNGDRVSLIYDKALTKCKYWTLVKSFKNSGTGNTIKVWMSNNE